MKLEVNTTKQDVFDLFEQLEDETKNSILEGFTASQIIDSLARHLKGESDFYAWDTSGWRWGKEVREAIANIQGIEEEMRKDYESKIRALEHDVKNYKQYYDWYFKLYHLDRGEEYENRLIRQAERALGSPTAPKKEEHPTLV